MSQKNARDVRKVLLERCRQKTARGNVYADYDLADSAAERMSDKVGGTIRAFRCPICDLYHLGGRH